MPTTPRTRLFVATLEDRRTPSATVATTASPFAVGSRAGEAASATVYNADGTVDFTVTPFTSLKDFTGGVHTALADVTGDGTADLIVSTGPGGGSLVEIYDGASHDLVDSFSAYESTFTGGTYIAAADLNGDGRAEVITGAAEDGGPRVRVFDGASLTAKQTPTTLADFLAIDDPNFRGGVRLAVGDIGGDGVPDLLVGAGRGGGPRVAAFDGAALASGQVVKLFADFFAYEPTLRNGVYPSVGDLNGDGVGDLIFGAGPGGGPRVRALDGRDIRAGKETELANFFAGDSSSRQGVDVTATTNSDGTTSIACTDLSTNATSVFNTSGKSTGTLSGQTGGTSTLPVFGGGYTADQADSLAKSLVASYSGSGTGLEFALSDTAVDVSGTSTPVTLTVNITSATAVLPSGVTSTTDLSKVPLRALKITGTVTVETASGTLTLDVTGTLQLARGRSTDTSMARGVLVLLADRSANPTPATGTGLALTASLNSDGITVSRLLASDRTTSPGYIIQSPESRTADKIVLTTKAATTTTTV